MKIYIIRHGETDWNKQKRMQGRSDISLNDYGRELARITRDGLNVSFDYIFSSPLRRAVETAEILRGTGDAKIVTDERLYEISFGEYEGMYPDERPKEFMLFFDRPEEYKPVNGGESYQSLCRRTRDFIENTLMPLSENNKDANVLISGHGAMNKALMMYLKNLEIKDIWSGVFSKNCSVSVVDMYKDKWTILQENTIYY